MIRSGFNVLYHNFVQFEAKTPTNDVIEDCTSKESFEVVAMFYTKILFTWSEDSYEWYDRRS